MVTAPGEGFTQPLRPVNRSNYKETLLLEIGGSAAPWLDTTPQPLTLDPGKTGWASLNIRVPEDASPGTYSLSATVRSATFPEVHARFSRTYTVAATPAD